MKKSTMFIKAHMIAKDINVKVNNYSISFQIALKAIWKAVKAGRKVFTDSFMKNTEWNLTHINYARNALKGFNYDDGSYMIFYNQVANNDKVIIKVDDDMLFGFVNKFRKTGYLLKLDRNHLVFLKNYQVFNGFYGTHVILERKNWDVKQANKPFENMVESADLSFDAQVEIAKKQDEYNKKHGEIARVGRMGKMTTINGTSDFKWSFC